ncbi:hypothetical protein DCO17_03260 [Polynucleobacter tropicus]|uniref:Uncharacterized protein n=1 Tax=Polynucleobacter tropicus TaxID=1743174 RepID=A0A6M9PNS8_9BURK|nr:hypothetical protein [Polynucleobacter tropicus]QKM64340.1 hypothetical protein DCO17_03260 [Polynucleobacter tropicus]
MRDTAPQSRGPQVALKITAIICGSILLLVSAHTGSASLDFGLFSQFVISQVQSSQQLQWIFGIIFLTAGIVFVPIKAKTPRSFSGAKELGNDSYVLYLVDKYSIEKNLVLDQLIVRDKIFSNAEDALAFAHAIECPAKASAPATSFSSPEVAPSAPEEPSPQPINQSGFADNLKNPFSRSQAATMSIEHPVWSEAKRIKVTVVIGVLLVVIVLGSLFYANSHSLRNNVKAVTVTEPAPSAASVANTDQVVSGTIASQDTSNAPEAKETGKPSTTVPINERWIGLWAPEGGGKQKLSVTASLMKYGDEEFSWVGVRPKGIVQCCLAFYEGATTKADLLARISGAQDSGATLKPEPQKTLALVNGLSDGNFKRIVFADPFLKKYFFIYDQNFVYRISRDLGDKADVVVEQFKKQE